jgi:Zn-dependent hydrolases, including glyoxylases
MGYLGAAVLWAAALVVPGAAQAQIQAQTQAQGQGQAADARPDNQPVKPFAIADGFWWVGASDVAAYLLQTNKGLILIDGGYETTAPQILDNIRRLGFDPKSQVKIILNTHAHLDHAGGLAALKAATGAKVLASGEDGKLMARGGKGDFFLGDRAAYPPVKPDGTVRDGQKVKLGERTLTAHITPGHTRGCTTWTFPVTVDGQPRQAMILCSNTILPGYRLTGEESYPGIAADYEKSYRAWRAMPCDIFLGSHGRFFGMAEKAKSGKPDAFVDPEGCRAYFEKGYAAFQAELARQKTAGQ